MHTHNVYVCVYEYIYIYIYIYIYMVQGFRARPPPPMEMGPSPDPPPDGSEPYRSSSPAAPPVGVGVRFASPAAPCGCGSLPVRSPAPPPVGVVLGFLLFSFGFLMVFISLSLWWTMCFIMIFHKYFLVLHYGLPYEVAMTFFYSSDVFLMFPFGSLWFCNSFLCFFSWYASCFSHNVMCPDVFCYLFLMVCLCYPVFSDGLPKVFFMLPHVLHVGGFLWSGYGFLCSPIIFLGSSDRIVQYTRDP